MTTQNFVTLPREVVDRALHTLDIAQSLCESWKSQHHPNMLATYNKLRAALTEQVQPAQGEREKFESWVKARQETPARDFRICAKGSPMEGEYAHQGIEGMWQAWNSALSTAPKHGELDILAEYCGDEGRRQWLTGGAWLYPRRSHSGRFTESTTMTTTLKIPNPVTYLVTYENGDVEYHTEHTSLGETEEPLYTISALRNVLEQAARLCEKQWTGTQCENVIRAMIKEIPE